MFENTADYCAPPVGSHATFEWSAKGVGFGQVCFYWYNDKLYCSNELMGREFIKQMLCKMVDDSIMDLPK